MRHPSSAATAVALGAAALSLQLAAVDAMITCPRPTSGPGAALTAGSTVTISVTPSNQICTLTRLTTTVDSGGNSNTDFAPVGRSYNGRDWDAVAGPYKSEMSFECSALNGSNACVVTLPQLDDPATQSFVLTSYAHTVTPEEEVARFLEQTTFGVTKADMEFFNTESLDAGTEFPAWVADQITNKEATAHRAYFRSRANGRATRAEDEVVANADKPCNLHSRWKKYAFGWEEARAWTETPFTIKIMNNSTEWMVILNEKLQPITEVPQSSYGAILNDGDEFSVCYATERADAPFAIRLPGIASCTGISSGNPLIQFVETTPQRVLNMPSSAVLQEVDTAESQGSELILAHTGNANGDPIDDDVCKTFASQGGRDRLGGDVVHAKSTDGTTWYMHDPRIILQENTLETPLSDGGGANMWGSRTICAGVTQNFLNQDTCHMSMEASTCFPGTTVSTTMVLNEDTLRDFYDLSGGRLIYLLNMTEPDVGPCILGSSSRWLKRDALSSSAAVCEAANPNADTVDAGTKTLIEDKISKSNSSPFIKDLQFSTSDTACNGNTPKGAFVYAVDACYEHVHDDEHNIYDFTAWADIHPGGSTSISQFAERGEVYLSFPYYKYGAAHPQSRWTKNKGYMPYVGRFGDELNFDDLTINLRTQAIADFFGASSASEHGIGTMVCGSPGEVANNALFGALAHARKCFKHYYPFHDGAVMIADPMQNAGCLRDVTGEGEGKTLLYSHNLSDAAPQQAEKRA
jgi:hypothetical protein